MLFSRTIAPATASFDRESTEEHILIKFERKEETLHLCEIPRWTMPLHTVHSLTMDFSRDESVRIAPQRRTTFSADRYGFYFCSCYFTDKTITNWIWIRSQNPYVWQNLTEVKSFWKNVNRFGSSGNVL